MVSSGVNQGYSGQSLSDLKSGTGTKTNIPASRSSNTFCGLEFSKMYLLHSLRIALPIALFLTPAQSYLHPRSHAAGIGYQAVLQQQEISLGGMSSEELDLKYTLREQNDSICNAGVKQWTGLVDVSEEKKLFFCECFNGERNELGRFEYSLHIRVLRESQQAKRGSCHNLVERVRILFLSFLFFLRAQEMC